MGKGKMGNPSAALIMAVGEGGKTEGTRGFYIPIWVPLSTPIRSLPVGPPPVGKMVSLSAVRMLKPTCSQLSDSIRIDEPVAPLTWAV